MATRQAGGAVTKNSFVTIFAVLAVFLPKIAFATDYTWSGLGDNTTFDDWQNYAYSNFDEVFLGGPPTCDDIVIPPGGLCKGNVPLRGSGVPVAIAGYPDPGPGDNVTIGQVQVTGSGSVDELFASQDSFSNGSITTQGFYGYGVTLGSAGKVAMSYGLTRMGQALDYNYITDFNVQSGGQLTTAGDTEVIYGVDPGADTGVAVNGTGSIWNVSGDLAVLDSTEALQVIGGGKLGVAGAINVGDSPYDQSLPVTGNQNGALSISSGGTATSATGYLGNLAGTTGTVAISGTGSTWTVAGGTTSTSNTTLAIGNYGTGSLSISGGGVLSSGSLAAIGYEPGSTGAVTVNGQGSNWNAYGITIGANGSGNLTVSNQGMVNAGDGIEIGAYGKTSDDTLRIQSGGDVISGNDLFIGIGGDSGSAIVTGAGSTLTVNAGSLRVGSSGPGSLDVFSGAGLTAASGVTTTVGGASGSGTGNGTLFIAGMGTTATLNGALTVGDASGTGLVRVETGATLQVTAGMITLGNTAGSNGTFRLYGGTLTAPNIPLMDGVAGTGELDIEDGSSINLGAQALVLGQLATGSGTVKVVTGGKLTVANLTLGGAGTGELDLGGTDAFGGTGPGTVNITGQLNIGVAANSTGTLMINGASTLTFAGISDIGQSGTGTIDLESGGKLTLGAVTLGTLTGGKGKLIAGSGTNFTANGDLTVGNAGTGTLNVAGGNVMVAGNLNVGKSAMGSNVSVTSGGTISAQGAFIGAGGPTTVTIDGAGSALSLSQNGLDLFKGSSITVSADGVLMGNSDAGDSVSGNLTVTGTGSKYMASGDLDLAAGGALSVLAGGQASGQTVTIGATQGMGTVRLDGAGSKLSDTGVLQTTNGATVTVSGGAQLDASQANFVSIGIAGAPSTLTVTGQGSSFNAGNAQVNIGNGGVTGTGNVQVLAGGQLNTGTTTLTGGFTKTGYVSGAGSNWQTGNLTLQKSADILADQGGSLIVSGNANVQQNSNLRADNGTIKVSGDLNMGTDESGLSGSLSLQDSSSLQVTGSLSAGAVFGASNKITLDSSTAAAASMDLTNTTVNLTDSSSVSAPSMTLFNSNVTADATSSVNSLSQLLVELNSTVNLSAGSSMSVSNAVGLSRGTIMLGSAGFLAIGSGKLVGPSQAQLIVFPNGELSGVGNIFGTTLNGGVVHVGDDPGTITIHGNYQQSSTGMLAIEVGPTSTSLLDVTGAAMIDGGTLDLAAVDGGMINLGQTYRVLAAAGGITGGFTTVETSSPFIALSTTLAGGTIDFTAEHAPDSFAAVAQTANQAAVARALDQAAATASGDFYNGLNSLSNASVASVRASFDKLSGEAYGDFATVALHQSYGFRSVLLNRLNDLANGAGDSIRLAANGSGSDAGLRFTTAAPLAGPGADPSRPDRPYFVWADGTGDFSGVSGENDSHGFNATSAGVTAGFDARITPIWMTGIAFGYDHESVAASGLGSTGTADNYNISLYSGLTLGRAYLRGAIGYSGSNDSLARSLDIGGSARAATGKPDGQQVFAATETGYDVPLTAALVATPFARLDAAHYWENAFAETGADDFDLLVAGQTNNSVQSTLGTKLQEEFNLLKLAEPLTATATVGWGHEFADIARSATAAFVGAPGLPFTVDAADADRNTAILGASIDMIAGKANIFVRYDGQYGASTHASAVTGGVSVAW
jgi:T5SS/PEP-CTERM-associated repeat protein